MRRSRGESSSPKDIEVRGVSRGASPLRHSEGHAQLAASEPVRFPPQPIHRTRNLQKKWRTCKANGALPNVAMKDAPVNTVRFFEAFDFMSAAETWLHAHKPRSVSAFRVRRPLGTCDALSRLMLKKNEKPNIDERALRVVTAADFTAEVLASKQPVLVEFSTSWSRACHVMDSVLQALAAPKRTRGARASDTCEGKFKVVRLTPTPVST